MAMTASLAMMAAGAALSAVQAQQAAKARTRANNSAFDAQSRQVQLAHQIQERQRKRVLSRETAARRARFGAGGTGSSGGSSAAVIKGLKTESARRGLENAKSHRAGLQSSLVNVQNSNRAALLKASHQGQNAIFGAVSRGLGAVAPAASGMFNAVGNAEGLTQNPSFGDGPI